MSYFILAFGLFSVPAALVGWRHGRLSYYSKWGPWRGAVINLTLLWGFYALLIAVSIGLAAANPS